MCIFSSLVWKVCCQTESYCLIGPTREVVFLFIPSSLSVIQVLYNIDKMDWLRFVIIHIPLWSSHFHILLCFTKCLMNCVRYNWSDRVHYSSIMHASDIMSLSMHNSLKKLQRKKKTCLLILSIREFLRTLIKKSRSTCADCASLGTSLVFFKILYAFYILTLIF